MACKRFCPALFLTLACLLAAAMPSQAAESVQPEEAAILAELAEEEAAASAPSIPPIVGGMGLVVLLVFGVITSRNHRTIEEEGYDPVREEHRVGDPYSRLAGKGKKRHIF